MGLVAPRSAFGSLIAVIVLAFGAADAHAVTYNFSVSPSPPNQDAVTTFRLIPTSAQVNAVFWDLDGDGDFDDGTSRTVTRTYTSRGSVTVRMAARETSESQYQVVTKTITVNGRPAADFGFTPGAPMAGEAVDFTPEVNDPEGDDVTLGWAFGDGEKSSQGAPTHTFEAAGTYDVVLTATDERGAVTTVIHAVEVAEDPGPTPSFVYAPTAPMDGDTITFTSTSSPSQGSIDTVEWDLDADGAYEAVGDEVTAVFGPGVHQVAMRVTQANGKQAVAFSDVEVAERPPPPPPPDPGDPGPADPGAGEPAPGPSEPEGGAPVT